MRIIARRKSRMNTRKAASLFVFALFLIFTLNAVNVHAQTYAMGAQCWTSASNTNPYPIQATFNVGDTVYIYWTPYNPSTGNVDINIYSPDETPGSSTPYSSFIDQSPSSAPVSFVPNAPGTWVVTCNGYSATVTVTPVFVMPESILGTLSLMVASFAAFAVFTIKKKATGSAKIVRA